MKNCAPLAIVCFAAVIYGLIEMPKGYTRASKTFYGYENQPRQDVERILSIIMPNVQFKVYRDPEQEMYTEEGHFGRIRLVVNDEDVVILPPKYFGIEPNLSFAPILIGKSNVSAVNEIHDRIPKAKIVVQSEDGTTISESITTKEDYILVEVSTDEMKVTELPKFVRVPKE